MVKSDLEWDWQPKKMWRTPAYNKADVRSVQSLHDYAAGKGSAPSPGEVKRALDWIIEQACGTYKDQFWPADTSRQTDYMLGRRSVGVAIIGMMKIKPESVKDDRNTGSD